MEFILSLHTYFICGDSNTSCLFAMNVADWLPTLMGLATGGEWSGSMAGADLDGLDMWASLMGQSDVQHEEIVHYLDSSGSVAYQQGDKKLVYSLSAPFIEPSVIFEGTKLDTAVCPLLGD